MGFEGKRQSLDEILAAVDNGEITPGDKGYETITTPDGTDIRYSRTTGEISFTKDGIVSEAEISKDKLLRTSHKDADNSYHQIDVVNARMRDDYLKHLLDTGVFD